VKFVKTNFYSNLKSNLIIKNLKTCIMKKLITKYNSILFAIILCLSGTITSCAQTWSAAASMAGSRIFHTATLLPNGKVLVIGGGDGAGGSLSSCELYDPLTNSWTAAAPMAVGREAHTATLLPNGKVLVVGGQGVGVDNYLSSCELYDPLTNSWSAAAAMTRARCLHTVTLLSNGKLLVTGGANANGYLSSCELYDPLTNSWTASASMADSRSYHTATLLPNGRVLVTAGFGGNYLSSCELYDPLTNSWSAAASMTGARDYQTATLLSNGRVLVTGGINGSGFLASCELYDPVINTWSTADSMAGSRYAHTATLLSNGKMLAVGDGLGICEIYDPVAGIWSATASMAGSRRWHTATLLLDGKLLVTGGNLNSCELYTPASCLAPIFSVCPSNISTNLVGGSCTVMVPYVVTATGTPAPALSFSFSGATTVSGNGTASGAAFRKGITNVTITAANGCGTNVSCNFTVTVVDNQKPSFTCPVAQNVDLSTNCKLVVPDLTTGLTGSDNCETVTFTQDPAAGVALTSSDNQTHNIVITADDGNGNTEKCTVVLTAKDATKPTFTCPVTQNVDLNAVCKLVIPDLTTGLTGSDNCGAVTFTQDPAAGVALTSSDNQTHNIVITADDGNGNTEKCTVVLTAKDVTKPTFTCPVAQNVDLSANCKLVVPDLTTGLTGSDNCGTVTFTQDPAAGVALTSSDNQTHNIVITADDGNGNTEKCTVVLTAKDVTKPTFTCPVARNVDLNVNCKLVVPDLITGLTGSESCGTVTFTQDPAAATVLSSSHSQTHNVVLTADDGNGNTTQCTVVLTGKDVTQVSFTCPADRNVNLTGICKLVVPNLLQGLTGNDNCGTVKFTQNPPATSILPSSHNQTHDVYIFANDGNGNITQCTVVLTAKDGTKPIIKCPEERSCTRSSNTALCAYKIIGKEFDASAYDNCAPMTLSWSIIGATTINGSASMAGVNLNSGLNTITWTATDLAANKSTCSITVNVKAVVNEIKGPSSVCKGALITLSDATSGGLWSSSNTSIATVDAGKVSGITVGSVTISYAVACGTVTKKISVNPILVVASITGASSVNKGATITLANASTRGVWSSSNTSIATVSKGKVTGKKAGIVTISYTVSNNAGCATTVTKSIQVINPSGITSKTSESDKPTESNLFSVKAYPNPTNHEFTLVVEGSSNERIEVMIYDIFGRMVNHIENSDGQPILFGEKLPVGYYIAVVRQGTNQQTLRLIKQE
jgi:hypothetical protein